VSQQLVAGPPFRGYLYSYPHKTAHGPIDPPLELEQVWAGESTDALFLYLHVPFCEGRCGYCNLLTAARPDEDQVAAWQQSLSRQVQAYRRIMGHAHFARFAIGGGTPTYLETAALERILDLMASLAGDTASLPSSVETSPATATSDRLQLLVERGATRISLGVQSTVESEVLAVRRPQRRAEVEAAVTRIRDADPAVLNIDLIYGLPRQTPASWVACLERVLSWRPEEIYLYPLYARPHTALSALTASPSMDRRLELYRLGRDRLVASGYRQISMRLFHAPWRPVQAGPPYRCQEDGMVGLGVGARSYTTGLHYSSPYAVSDGPVRRLIDAWNRKADHGVVDHGIRLDLDEQKRRWLILSLLHADGLSARAYRARFASDPTCDFPQLEQLTVSGLAGWHEGALRLTRIGLERSDCIGPWLVSRRVRRLMESAEVA
jgi:oxygen-independent coproporphyrinogen-3 oxidase